MTANGKTGRKAPNDLGKLQERLLVKKQRALLRLDEPDPDGANIVKGRNMMEGYLRGSNIQYGDYVRTVASDPLFARAYALVKDLTLVSLPKLVNLYSLVRFYLPRLAPGQIVEFGSYRGGSAILMAFLARQLGLEARVYALDTFEGMPETAAVVDWHKQGDFAETSLAALETYRDELGLDNLHFVKGRFEDTAEALFGRIGPVALAHVDCDIESAVRYAYDTVRERMVPGGYVVFDDPLESCCLGAFQVVEECLVARDGLLAEQVYPHLVYRYPPLAGRTTPPDVSGVGPGSDA
ncbi:macrocin-O-methyltransferase (plasmid) [Solidesulfovibrio carbinoliphilus subsp. oakridgensis]|uniref:Macrocin-O-methyltransferase n=1 Tax=Solidesulfovibrio carbinoliphilus subsp. oakridgensis TaxID=694327 RepID=G7QE66_9BACT|nr:TylF/MycF/NovP-related O-methyltransferase [Solidesulfovibrio carbinoliphilus]EHJ45960.1 macrocin-O-methyltransferase [Solidesulfovibrio carbinoliphilus subsp. oakridgensis]